MEYAVRHDALGTHLDWSLNEVTARQIDWFWSNMEKAFVLWHPEQHEYLEWPVPVKHGDLRGAIHNAPQTWRDGKRQNLYIRYENLADVAPEIRDVLTMKHAIVVAGLGFDEQALAKGDPMGYRIHQWEPSDSGVIGMSSGIGTRRKETVEDGKIWAEHCAQEVGNWEVFLPDLYRLYKVVEPGSRNPFTDLSLDGKGRNASFSHMK
ncbi:MAG: hypothetical protein KDA67_11310 [Rhodobacteraceae bacterium]|nr:hypothetical protein [Paracoccaceae bacterium]